MRFTATGIVTNEYNQLLLIQRSDTKTWTAPTGEVVEGELPTETVTRLVEEKTGVKVMPIRLVWATYWAQSHDPHLHLIFRCLQRGGEAKPTSEALVSRFFSAEELPQPMRKVHQKRIEMAVYHDGQAEWLTEQPTIMQTLSSKLINRGASPATSWTADCISIISDEENLVAVDGQQQLPSGRCRDLEAPWDAAPRLTKTAVGRPIEPGRLSGIYLSRKQPHITFVFRTPKPAGLTHPHWLPPTTVALPEGAKSLDFITADDVVTEIDYWGEN